MEHKNNPIVVILGFIIVFALAYYLGGLQKENQLLKGTQGKPTGQETAPTGSEENPISLENLNVYAKELKLKEAEFNKCVSEKKYKTWMEESTAYGQSLGVAGTPNFFINGKILGGAFPIELFKEVIDKELNNQGSVNIADYSQELQDAAKQAAFNPAITEVEIKKGTPQKGGKDATVSIIEFTDPSCPYCTKAAMTLKELFTEYKDKISLAFYYFPGHGTGEEAMEAMMCAGDQGKFWEMHDKIFDANAKIMGL